MNVELRTKREASGGDGVRGYEASAPKVDPRWVEVLLGKAVGSAGVIALVAGYGPSLPYVGTSPSIVDLRPLPGAPRLLVRASTRHAALTLSSADQARELLAGLSLNKSQLAEVLRISRPTLYEWLEGKEPNAANAERLSTLLRLLADVGVTSAHPLHARFVRQALVERGPVLLEVLCADVLDERTVRALARDAKELGQRVDARRSTREVRLRALGFEDRGEDERRAQLERNVAMRDWPKT